MTKTSMILGIVAFFAIMFNAYYSNAAHGVTPKEIAKVQKKYPNFEVSPVHGTSTNVLVRKSSGEILNVYINSRNIETWIVTTIFYPQRNGQK